MLTATPPAAERWQQRSPLRVIAERLKCSYDHLWKLYKSGFLSCIRTPNGLETTEAEVIAAWAKRAEDGVDNDGARHRRSNEKKAAADKREWDEHAARCQAALATK